MFRGQTNLAIDAKGRLTLPARYREQIAARSQGKLIITADSPSCLLIYPLDAWEPIEAAIMRRPTIDPQVRHLQRQLVGRASEQELDAAGRVLLPPALREVAQLTKDVALVGMHHRFECWDLARWNESVANDPVTLDPANPNLRDLSW